MQAQTLPMILTPPYRSLIAQAHNGSGKTTCFTLGMLGRVDPALQAAQVRRRAARHPRWLSVCAAKCSMLQCLPVCVPYCLRACSGRISAPCAWRRRGGSDRLHNPCLLHCPTQSSQAGLLCSLPTETC